jgi:hypothetical protein
MNTEEWHARVNVSNHDRFGCCERATFRAGTGQQLQTMQRTTARLHVRLFWKDLPDRV